MDEVRGVCIDGRRQERLTPEPKIRIYRFELQALLEKGIVPLLDGNVSLPCSHRVSHDNDGLWLFLLTPTAPLLACTDPFNLHYFFLEVI